MKGELADFGDAVVRNDAVVAPLRDSGTELMAELRCIDQQECRPVRSRPARRRVKVALKAGAE